MKKWKFTLMGLSLFLASATYGQTDSMANKAHFSDIYVLFGNFGGQAIGVSYNTALQLAPQSVRLANPLGYQATDWNYDNNQTFTFVGQIGIKLPKKRFHTLAPTLRLGLMYNQGTVLANAISKRTRVRTDSLTNSQGAVVRYVDRVNRETIVTNYQIDELYADANLTYSINQRGRFSMFLGIGVGIGAFFNSNTDVVYTNTAYTSEYALNDRFETNTNFSTEEYEQENFRNDPGFAAMAYLPVGLDFKLGKKNEAWQKAHVFVEFRPGVQIRQFPEANYTVFGQFVAGHLGFRIQI